MNFSDETDELWKFYRVSSEIIPNPPQISHQESEVPQTHQQGQITSHKSLPLSYQNLEDVSEAIGDCKRCRLCEERNEIVFGEGNNQADIMFVGEGPGRDEDKTGRPFVGRAGKLLDKIILAMGTQRQDVYIANVVKCRPPENRAPLLDEVAECSPFLENQIRIIKPKVIITLGLSATHTLLQTDEPMAKLRSRFQSLEYEGFDTIPVMPTYHPAYLLRNPAAKKHVWHDIKIVMKELSLIKKN